MDLEKLSTLGQGEREEGGRDVQWGVSGKRGGGGGGVLPLLRAGYGQKCVIVFMKGAE